MQLKKYTDYGLRILMYLASRNDEKLTTIREICDVFDLSANHVNKVVHHLGQLELITTKRGKNGGFSLSKSPDEIHLDYVIRQLEGDEPWIDCHSSYCVAVPACKLRGLILHGKEQFYQYLHDYTVADLMTGSGAELATIFRQRLANNEA